ncbi:MAG: aspartate kinase [Dehalococcoidia bacterium]|nr:aspartate kinase [Dehalococcoidia bacterium]
MELVVQKYGGSSVANADLIRNVAQRICQTSKGGAQVVAVVSAMGDTTEDLIALAKKVAGSPDVRELDLLLSTGELVSSTLLAMAIRSLGHEAISLSGFQAGIRTDSRYGKARISAVETERIKEEMDKGRLVVVAGFQGITEDMDVTTLGRGGSDTTAVALAAALEAQRCEIYTDVDGIYTADPQVVPGARKLERIDYEEMLELASYGAKMHPRSIELGSVYNVPIYVASSFSETSGTLIEKGIASAMEQRVKVTGIPYDRNVARITLRRVPDHPGIAAALFEPLSNEGISVDTIVQNSGSDKLTDLSFTLARTELERALEIVAPVAESVGAEEVTSDATLSKVSIIGSGMQHAPGYASRMFRALAENNINIEMITTSEIRITCIVPESVVHEATRVLHDAFELDQG